MLTRATLNCCCLEVALVEEDDEVRALFSPTTPSFVKTPNMLNGMQLTNSIFGGSSFLRSSESMIEDILLRRTISEVFGIQDLDDDWVQLVIGSVSNAKGGAVSYYHPVNRNKKYYHCINMDCGIDIRVDGKLIGIAATIHCHIYMSQLTDDYNQSRKHMNAAGELRDYCYTSAGKAGYSEFTTTLFDLLCADVLEDSE